MARSKAFIPEKKLEKAKNLFWEKGYHSTSMQDLVEIMEVNRGSIYDTYGDKHALFIQCLTSYTKQTVQIYKAAAAGTQSPLEAIKSIIHSAIDRLCQQSKACMVVKASFEMADTDKVVNAVIKAEDKELLELFKGLLKEGQNTGEIDESKNVTTLATYIVSSFAGWWQNYIIYKDKKSILKLADFLLESIKR
jgi:TetR/AcrR family transcriptional repressor of nem operon